MRVGKIPVLESYGDWLEKAKYDLSRYANTYGIYELVDCLLTLNAIPDWIRKSNSAPKELRKIADEKTNVMKCLVLNENELDEIDQKLRFVRLFCNHSKHADPKEKFPQITMSASFPMEFPVKFANIKIGDSNFKAIEILKDVIDFWDGKINNV